MQIFDDGGGKLEEEMADDLVKWGRAVTFEEWDDHPEGCRERTVAMADRIEELERLYIGALNDGERVYGDLVECRGMVDTARREALAEAEWTALKYDGGTSRDGAVAANAIAAAIRALKGKKDG